MITWQELHIGFDQEIDKVHSGTVQSFSESEIDWWLNRAQLELLKPSPVMEQMGLSSSQRKVDKQEELIKRKTLPMYVYTAGDFRQYAFLPSDYLYLESDASNLVYNCNGVNQTPQSKELKIAYLPFPNDPGSTPFYTGFKIWLDTDTPIYDISLNPSTFNDIADLDLKYLVTNDAFDTLKDNVVDGLEVYWEKFGNVYRKNTLIFVSSSSTPPTTLKWGWAIGVPEANIVFSTLSLLEMPTITTKIDYFKPNRELPLDREHEIRVHAFGKTSYKSPISRLYQGNIEVHINTTFNVVSVEIEYVRVPKRINHLVEQGSELNANMHPELVTLAVSLALDSIAGGARNELFKQNLINN